MYSRIKRLIDVIAAVCCLPLLLPVLVLSAICIKLEDGGPVFYLAPRIGRKGKIFKMYKLRSMKVDAPDIRMADGSTYNAKDDPRVTRFGKFARRTSIDELPQILNIIKGDMSLIGPRPDTAGYLSKYTRQERIILTVRPGITGYSQAINRNGVGTKQKLQNDIYYVKHLSPWLDIKIVFMTIRTVLFARNVYRVEEVISEERAI